MAAWARYEAGEGPYQAEYRVRRSDGLEIWGSASAELIRDETGKPVTLVGAIQNVTDRKRGEIELIEALSRAEAAILGGLRGLARRRMADLGDRGNV